MMNSSYENTLPIKTWAEADRPREKMQIQGRSSMSDAELLAILLRSGTQEETAVDLARRILSSVRQDLNALGKCSLSELTRFKGMGMAKAVTVVAALELGRRRQLSPVVNQPQVRSSQDAHRALAPLLMDLPHEEFWILLLNRANRIIGKERISTGGVSGTVVDAKLVFRKALETLACSIILSHNHPSGNLTASQADLDLTKKLRKAGKSLDIEVLDHLIISDSGYLSFADEGML
jgi:DNA repair protein RadC